MTKDNNKIWIIDTTLRDGEQAPGVAFSRKEKIKLASMLNDIGIDEIEAGTPAMNEEVTETIRQIARLPLKSRILVWSRALIKDIESAAATEADSIHIAFPISSIQLTTMGKDWQWVERSVPAMINHARRFFNHISIGAQDVSRCEAERILQFISMGIRCNADRIRLADTVGILTPIKTAQLINELNTIYPDLDIDFHAHNDLGMATANAITAWQAGAKSLSVTVNGLGERAGNAALEEVLMMFSLNSTYKKYDTSLLFDLCTFVSKISNRPIPQGKAICGEMVFSHESGIHAKGTLSNPIAFQAFDGKLVGRESYRNLFGKHSGTGALQNLLTTQHISYDARTLAILKEEIYHFSQKHKRNISLSEIMECYCNLK